MRLFAAVEPPRDALAHLAAVVDGVRDDVLRWSDRAGWHLTLAFYGEVGEDRLTELTERLARAARRHPATQARIAGAGRFGRAVLWAGVDGDGVALRALAGSARAAGRRIGVGSEERQRFRPHVTLARARGAADLRPYVERLAPYAGPEWTADTVTLFRSRPGGPGHGPRYEALARFPLTGRR
ncbi:RNA 2',3'-cyclic phosphodiesterase [Jiangella aurantiaca]|uniref:RNA 2',3'-cyclic phosphodiesterase n=1 Tax=Jiangella aurantiaca TaxID=2530373 RepID=A0A4R5A1V0_9ACTN|nr:RNA 2',3'-cyclic phosphodiesterase [Jiangella aurantiaca]TDD65753.1 RNA 2',3'-cyclic phosphodiesterase [Jiangella aurantiaca]